VVVVVGAIGVGVVVTTSGVVGVVVVSLGASLALAQSLKP
jgi:hypothetical protein